MPQALITNKKSHMGSTGLFVPFIDINDKSESISLWTRKRSFRRPIGPSISAIEPAFLLSCASREAKLCDANPKKSHTAITAFG